MAAEKQRGTKNLRLRGPIHAATTIVKEEGPRALWNGVAPTMLRQGSNQAFNFMAFAYLSEKVFGRVEGDGKQQAAWKPFLTGLVSSTIGPLTNCPLDVAKSRLQAQENRGEEKARYRGFVHCIRSVAKEEGVAALWKGITPRLMRLAPGQAITWTIVQRVQTKFEELGIGLVEPAKKY